MATVGIKHPVFAPITAFTSGSAPTYGTGFVVGKAIKSDITISTADGTLYADDAVAEYASQFQSGTISFECDDISDNNRCTMFGYTTVAASGGKSGVKMGALDEAPHGGFGYYKTKIKNGTKFYVGKWFYNTIFHETADNAETKKDSITFQTISIEGKILPVVGFGNDTYCEECTASTESEVVTWLNTKAGIAG